MKRRNMFLDDGIWARLSKLSKQWGCSVSEVVRRAIIELLKREGK